jgi:Zn-dependent M28 family amino/carboxypeptidase
VIVLAAHYDSRTVELEDAGSPAPGANDNATGVAVLLEMARLLSDETFEAGLVFACFSAEEINAGGSRYYLAQAQGRGDPIAAVIVLDIVGNSAGEGGAGSIRAFSALPPDSASRGLARALAYQADAYLPGFEVSVEPTIDRPGRYSDHIPFSDAGIPAARLIEAIETPSQQHSALDLPIHVSPDYLRRATQLTLATAINLAGGPAQPSAPALAPVPEKQLEWEPVEGAAGYVVGLRGVEDGEYDTLLWAEEPTLSLTRIENADALRAVGVAAVGEDGLVGFFSPEMLLNP